MQVREDKTLFPSASGRFNLLQAHHMSGTKWASMALPWQGEDRLGDRSLSLQPD